MTHDPKVGDKNTVFETKNMFLPLVQTYFYHRFINYTDKKLQNCGNLAFFRIKLTLLGLLGWGKIGSLIYF